MSKVGPLLAGLVKLTSRRDRFCSLLLVRGWLPPTGYAFQRIRLNLTAQHSTCADVPRYASLSIWGDCMRCEDVKSSAP